MLLTARGFYMWPHSFGSIYTARSATVIRKNAFLLPLYQLILLFVFFVGFAATLQVPGHRLEHRLRPVQAVGENVRPLVRRRDRRDRRAHRAGARLDDSDDRRDVDRQQPLPRRQPVGRRSAGVATGEAPGAGGGAAAGIIAGVATVAAVSLTGANFHTLPWLPAQAQDLNIGIVAPVVNFIVLIVVSVAMRLATAPAHAAAE